MVFRYLVYTLAVAMCALVVPVYSQVNTPCSPSMNTSFIPCLILLTNSTTNGSTTTTSDCCKFLKTLPSNGIMDCLCHIVTGSVPFPIPFNRSLALSLPGACRMPDVPLQCKAAAAAPVSPTAPAPRSSSTVPKSNTTLTPPPPLAPESNTTPSLTPPQAHSANTTPTLTPPSTGVSSGAPSTNSGSRPTITPSAAVSTYDNKPFILAACGATFMANLMLF